MQLIIFIALLSLSDYTGAFVLQVIDGDTITVIRDDTGRMDRVRLIGVNAPEMRPEPWCGAQASTEYLRSLIEGQRVTLQRDVQEKDRYGRMLAYVWRMDYDSGVETMTNWEIVNAGYASNLNVPPNDRYKNLFRDAYRSAYAQHLGIYAWCRV